MKTLYFFLTTENAISICINYVLPLMFILVLQGYDSIPKEIPDPKAKEVS